MTDEEDGISDVDEEVDSFIKVDFDLENELEVVIEMEYRDPTVIKNRLFFGQKDSPVLFSRDYIETSQNNFIHLKIESTRAKNTTWNYKGTKEIGDNFEDGYSLTVRFKHNEHILKNFFIKILQSNNFGCFPGERTFTCHRDGKYPTDSVAKEILHSIVESFMSNKEKMREESEDKSIKLVSMGLEFLRLAQHEHTVSTTTTARGSNPFFHTETPSPEYDLCEKAIKCFNEAKYLDPKNEMGDEALRVAHELLRNWGVRDHEEYDPTGKNPMKPDNKVDLSDLR